MLKRVRLKWIIVTRAVHKRKRKRGTLEEHNLRSLHYSKKSQIKDSRAIIRLNFHIESRKSLVKVIASPIPIKGITLNLLLLHRLIIHIITLMDLPQLCPFSLTTPQPVCLLTLWWCPKTATWDHRNLQRKRGSRLQRQKNDEQPINKQYNIIDHISWMTFSFLIVFLIEDSISDLLCKMLY